MLDNGNETTFGHRRIVLERSAPSGSARRGPDGASCMQNNNGTGEREKTWMAWPSPGIIPLQAIRRNTNSLARPNGLEHQSNTLNVTARDRHRDGRWNRQTVTVSDLTGSYGGARYAIRIVPNGWQPRPAKRTPSISPARQRPSPTTYASSTARCEKSPRRGARCASENRDPSPFPSVRTTTSALLTR